MTDGTRTRWPNPLVLLSRSMVLWAQSLFSLLGLAVVSSAGTVVLAFLAARGLPILGLNETDLPHLILLPMVLAHSVFLVITCRRIAKRLGRVKQMSIGNCAIKGIVLAILMAVVLAPVLVWLPVVSVMVLMAFVALTPVLPALVMADLPRNIAFWGKFAILAFLVSLPWFAVTEFFGLPSQVAEGWGIMEGGIILIPLTAVHLFLASTSSAVVSTVIFVSLTGQTRLVVDPVEPAN